MTITDNNFQSEICINRQDPMLYSYWELLKLEHGTVFCSAAHFISAMKSTDRYWRSIADDKDSFLDNDKIREDWKEIESLVVHLALSLKFLGNKDAMNKLLDIVEPIERVPYAAIIRSIRDLTLAKIAPLDDPFFFIKKAIFQGRKISMSMDGVDWFRLCENSGGIMPLNKEWLYSVEVK